MRALCLAALLLVPGVAAADVVSPPPADCPAGTEARMCHGPSTCQVQTCTEDTDCSGNEVCVAEFLCVQENCCSGRLCGSPEGERVEHASATCEEGGTCASGNCVERRVCMPAGGGGCRVARPTRPRAGGLDVGLGLSFLVALALGGGLWQRFRR